MEFLFCKMLGKNLGESVRQLSHSQMSPGKSSCQDTFGKSLCKAIHSVILQTNTQAEGVEEGRQETGEAV